MDDLKEILAAATSGPWEVYDVEYDDGRRIGVTPNREFVGDVAKCDGHYSLRSHDEELANARLIAMAPDLAAEVLRLREALADARKQAFTEAINAISDQRCGANWNAISTAISEIQSLMKEQHQ